MRFKYTAHKAYEIEVDADTMLASYSDRFEHTGLEPDEEDDVMEFVEEILETEGINAFGIVSSIDLDECEIETWTGRRVD